MNYIIDINADLGEGFPFDALILPLVSSCSIASGGHFGDDNTMRKAIQSAKKNHVKVGAHPSFPDKENFGRREMKIKDSVLQSALVFQMKSFFRICLEEQVTVNHIKLHGALYHLAATNERIADMIIETIQEVSSSTTVYLPANSVFYAKAKDQLPVKREAFIDRRYTDAGTLVSRTHREALLVKPDQCLNQLVDVVTKNKVTTISGKKIKLQAETFCIHGDHKNSVSILKYLHQNLNKYYIQVE